jgi:type I restriction enzyme S subunit
MKRDRAPLGELCTLVKGISQISKTPPGAYPLVTTGEDHKTADTFQFDGEAICIPLISSTGHGHASLKRVHYQTGKFALGNLLAAALVKNGSVLSGKFLARYLTYTKDRLIVPLMTGVANMSISIDRLATVPVEFPSMAEQKQIVRLLDEVDELRKLRAQADSRTGTLIPALFHAMFGSKHKLPTASVAELAAQHEGSIRTGPFGSDLLHSEFGEQGIPVLGIDNVVENEFRWTKSRCVTLAKFDELRRFTVFSGDVLVTIMGTVGRCVVAPEDLPICISTKHLCAITVNQERIHPRYLWGAFLFDEEVRRQTRTVAQGAIMEGWNSTIIKRLSVRVPPLPLQKKFATRVAEIRELEAEQAASRRRGEDLYQSMLHHAFSGEL